jgi:cyclase
MLADISNAVSVPIIASGGAGCTEDFLKLFALPGMDAGLAASVFHRKQVDIHELKRYLINNGVHMRL